MEPIVLLQAVVLVNFILTIYLVFVSLQDKNAYLNGLDEPDEIEYLGRLYEIDKIEQYTDAKGMRHLSVIANEKDGGLKQ